MGYETGLEYSGLGQLCVWRDDTLRSAALNMAIDEVLTRQIGDGGGQRPLLRFYDWERPAVSIGYFQKWHETVDPAEIGELDLVRRWTGGGRVDHRQDWTYTLVAPREHEFFQFKPLASYQWVHRHVASALERIGAEAALTETENTFLPGGKSSPNCFDSPVRFDVVNEEGGKLAGAAQRRTRWGLLHQGSVAVNGLAEGQKDWEMTLADLLSGRDGTVVNWQVPPDLLVQAAELAEEKYASQSWLEKF